MDQRLVRVLVKIFLMRLRKLLMPPLVKELVSDDNVEKKTVYPTIAKIEFVRPKQQEKLVRKPDKYAEMYRSQSLRGNQRSWNNQKSQQLGSDFMMYIKLVLSVEVLTMCRLTALTIKGKGWNLGIIIQGQKAVNTARPNSAVVNVVRANQVNVVKASICWVWRPAKLNSASITLKRHNYVDAQGRSKLVLAWVSKGN
ncbi:hypothetical protein Tco_0037445 [Tanacetum coccineum]